MNADIGRRSWQSFTGGRLPRLARTVERGRHGYSLWHRAWASFIGFDLSARPGTPIAAEAPAVAPWPSAVAGSSQGRRVGRPAPGGWLTMPPLPSSGALTAAGGDAVVLEASSPDGRAGFLVRRLGTLEAEYSLELVLHGVDAARPLVCAITYTQSDGSERVLLVPVVQGKFGPPASFVRLPGLSVDTAWTATVPAPVAPGATWEAATVAASVRAALNDATRDAWRHLREHVDDDVRATIEGALQ